MGEVHIARRDGASSLCVLKQLRERADGDHLFRLKREAHVLSQLGHPNIGRLIDAGVDAGTFYLALELIPGQTLRRVLRRMAELGQLLPPEIALQVAVDVLDGLAYAHDQKDPEGRTLELVHRDLSPNNVMLSYEGRTKIIDFGIASGKVDDYRTMPGMILGTMRYISPEQALSKPVDRRSDIYTLGVVLYEMLTGRPVIEKGEQTEILDAVLRRKPQSFEKIAPKLVILWPPIAKAMEKRTMDRFESAAAFRAALLDAGKGIALASHEEIGRFLTRHFPEDVKGTSGRMLAPDDDTYSALEEEMSSTDRSEISETASEEQQPTQIDRLMGRAMLPVSVETLAPKKRRRSLGLPIAVVAVVAGAALMTALVVVLPRREPIAPSEPQLEEPQVEAAPKVVQLDPPAQQPVREEPPANVEKKVVMRRPQAKVEPPAQSSLRKKLVQLRETPDDVPLMTKLHAEILPEARNVANEDAIKAEADAALRVVDVDGMARAVEMLERAKSASE
jgi:serine/threonine protein kinase